MQCPLPSRSRSVLTLSANSASAICSCSSGQSVQEDARSPSQLLDDAARGLEHPRENRPHIDQAVPERHFPSSLALPTLPTAGPNGEGGGGGRLDPMLGRASVLPHHSRPRGPTHARPVPVRLSKNR